MPTSLPIESLESALAEARIELQKASLARQNAQEIEGQWTTEVNSLKNLIDVRKMRLDSSGHGSKQHSSGSVATEVNGGMATLEQISHVDRILSAIRASGDKGISPPEILKAAGSGGIVMHKNYPYVVLGKLVERGTVIKREGRYYAVQ